MFSLPDHNSFQVRYWNHISNRMLSEWDGGPPPVPRLQAPVHASLEHDLIRHYTGRWTWTLDNSIEPSRRFHNHEEGPLLDPSPGAFIYKTMLKHYANWAPKLEVNVNKVMAQSPWLFVWSSNGWASNIRLAMQWDMGHSQTGIYSVSRSWWLLI